MAMERTLAMIKPDAVRAGNAENATHGSDSEVSAQREIGFYFPNLNMTGASGLPTIEWTLAMIKPDAVKKGKAEEIKQLIKLQGFTIVAQEKVQLTRMRAEEFYAEHAGKPFFPNLITFMTSGPIWALVLAKSNAIRSWRGMMGPTNTLKAKLEAPKTLRALYGTDGTMNATHGSDAVETAKREIKFHFPKLVLEPLSEAESAKEYITSQLQPALAKALTALAREKPSAERFEALTFLADFLLNNNPNKPRIIMPDEWDPSMEDEDEEDEFANAKLAMASGSMSASAPDGPVSHTPHVPTAGAEVAKPPSQSPSAPSSRPASAVSQAPPAPPSRSSSITSQEAVASRSASRTGSTAGLEPVPPTGSRPGSSAGAPPTSTSRSGSRSGGIKEAAPSSSRPGSAAQAEEAAAPVSSSRPGSTSGLPPSSSRPTSARPGSALGSRPESASGVSPVPPSSSRPTSAVRSATGSRPASTLDPREEDAATTVQAAFRGQQARMELDEAEPEAVLLAEEGAPAADGDGEAAPPADDKPTTHSAEEAAPPAEEDAPPAERAATPPAERAATPPAEEDAPLAEEDAPPDERAATPPAEDAASAEEAPDAEGSAPAFDEDADPAEDAPPAEKPGTPPAEEAAPVAEDSAPPTEEAAPAEGDEAPNEEADTPSQETEATPADEADASAEKPATPPPDEE
eukprot:gene26071-11774_t